MLGVRREGVTAAAGKLQDLGVIDYWRGHITVLDRARLETLSCECHKMVKCETKRLLPWKPRRKIDSRLRQRDDKRTFRSLATTRDECRPAIRSTAAPHPHP